jgi:hypothetical protein
LEGKGDKYKEKEKEEEEKCYGEKDEGQKD